MPEDQNQGAAPEADALPSSPPAAPAAPVKRHVRRQATVTTTDPVTEVKTTAAVVTDTEADALPASVTLASPYGYYDEAGAAHWWHAGQVVTDAAEIADLTERGAIFAAEA